MLLPFLPELLHSVAVVHSFLHSFTDVRSNSDSTQLNNPATMCPLELHSPGHTAESISMLSVFPKEKELQFERMDLHILAGDGRSLDRLTFVQTKTAGKHSESP